MSRTLADFERATDVPASPIRASRAAGRRNCGARRAYLPRQYRSARSACAARDPGRDQAARGRHHSVRTIPRSAGNRTRLVPLLRHWVRDGADRMSLVTTGGGEAIGFAMMAIADPGDEILIFDPTYASYLGFAATGNIRARAHRRARARLSSARRRGDRALHHPSHPRHRRRQSEQSHRHGLHARRTRDGDGDRTTPWSVRDRGRNIPRTGVRWTRTCQRLCLSPVWRTR